MAVLENVRAIGVTTLGNGAHQAVLHVKTVATAEKPSILAMDAVDPTTGVRTTYYLWVDNTGDLRIHTSIPTNDDSDGTVVGAQS